MATIYSYNSNNRWCTYTLTMTRSGGTVTITASGSIYTNNTSGGDSSNTVYAQLRYGVSPAQTAANPAKNATGTTTYVTNYGTLITSTEGTTPDKGWAIKSKVTKNGSTTTYNNATVLVKPVDSSSSPSKPYSFIITWTKSTNDAINLSNVALFFFKHATSFEEPSNGSYAFIGKKDEQTANYSRYYTQSLSVGAGYSKTTAPSSVSTSVDLQKPGGSVEISWSGAAAGTSNPITGYRIYWRRGANPTTSTNDGSQDVPITTTSGSWTMNSFAGASYRDSTYYFKVLTLGTISGYNSDISSDNATCKVNNLPDPPTVTISQGTTTIGSTIYRNKINPTTIRFTPNATNTDDGQTNTFYYATSAVTTPTTSNTTLFTSSTNFEPNTTTTYRFWSYDGMEFSSGYTTKTITIGANLAGSMGATTSATTYSHDDNGTTITYTTAGTNTITLSSAGVDPKTYKWNLMYGASTSSMTSTQSLSSTSNSCTWAYGKDWGQYYYISCQIEDSLGQILDLRYPSTNNNAYYVPTKPIFNTNIYNQLGTNISTMPAGNVENSVANNFYQTVVTSLTKDTSIKLTFSLYIGSLTPTAKVDWYSGASDTTYRNSGVIPLTISGASGDTSYTLRITATPNWGNSNSFYKDYTIKRAGEPKVQIGTTIENFSSDDITLHGAEVKPFTSTANLNFSFKLGLTGYNFTKDALEGADAFLVANSAKVRIKEKENTNRATIDGVRYIYTQQGGDSANSGLYDWSTNATTLQLNMNSDTNPVSFRIEFTNVFGETFGYTKSGLNFDFIEDPSVSFDISSSAESTQDITIVKEGDTITYTPNVTFYNTDKAVTINTYIYRSTSNSGQSGDIWKLYNGTNSINGVTYTPNRDGSTSSAITYNIPITYTVGEIVDSRYLFFKIRVTYGSTTADSQIPETYYVSQRHKQITDLSAGATFIGEKFGYTTTLTDRGGGKITSGTSDTAAGLGEVNYGLQFSKTNNFSIIKTQDTRPIQNKKYYYINNDIYVEFEGENFVQGVEYYETTYQWLDPSGSLVTSINPTWRESSSGGAASYYGGDIDLGSGWSFYNIRAVYQTNIGSVTKTSYSSVDTIYNISPTVSYRQNQIGININNIEESPEFAVVIGAATVGETEVKYIKLQGANNTAMIDLDSGRLTNFKIDGNNIYPANFDTSSITDLTAGNLIVNGAISLVNPLSVGSGGTGASTATANTMFAGPASGSTGAPSFRALVAADIPNIAASKITSGTLAIAQGGTGTATAAINTVFAGPGSGSTAAPSFRTLVAADIPNLNASKITAGTLTVARGGTGQTSIANIQAGKDGNGDTISSTYLKLNGGTMTGTLTMQASQYADDYTGALNMNNSNIYGVNSIYTSDDAGSATEGISFYRTATTVDTIHAHSGVLYFTPNRTLGTSGTSYKVYHAGNLTYGTADPSGGANGDIYIKYS